MIQIAASVYPPYMEACGLRRLHPRYACPEPGLNAEIFYLLMNFMDVQYNITQIPGDSEMGDYDDVTKQWTGMYALIKQGKFDMYASLFALTELRMTHFGFSYPLLLQQSSFIVRKPPPDLWANATKLATVFAIDTWMVTAFILVLISVALTVEYMMFQDTPRHDGQLFYRTIGFILKAPPRHYQHLSGAGNVLLLLLGATLVLIKPLYQCYLPPMLLYPTLAQPLVSNMHELTEMLEQNRVHLIMNSEGNALMQEIEYSNVDSIVRLRHALSHNPVRIIRNRQRTIDLIMTGKYVTLASTVRASKMIQTRCDLDQVPAEGLRRKWLGILTTPNFTHQSQLNYAIYSNLAQIMALSQRYTERNSERHPCVDESNNVQLTLEGAAGTFCLMFVLFIVAAMVFVCEWGYKLVSTKNATIRMRLRATSNK